MKSYLESISGLPQKVTPDEGKSTIGGVTFKLRDHNGEITAMLGADPNHYHRKVVTVRAGYAGMDEADFLTVFTGWATGIKLSADGLTYVFTATDPQKWMQRKVFRSAESASVRLSGNPLNILLAVLTSTGTGANGAFDWYAESNGLGIDADFVDVAAVLAVRDNYYPGNSHYMSFVIHRRETAIQWLEKEIFKPLNLYPVIDGRGRFKVLPFRPPIGTDNAIQQFTDENIVGMPGWDMNLAGMVNAIEYYWDWDGSRFNSQRFDYHSDSINARGPGAKTLKIESKGWHSDRVDVDTLLDRRTSAVFNRYAVPPLKISLKTFFSQWLTEAGDIVPVTHRNLPDINAGVRGLAAQRMEVIERSVDWAKGGVSLNLLDTGFAHGQYGVISPVMTITGASDSTHFTVSAADAAKYRKYTAPEVCIYDHHMRLQVTGITLTAITAGGAVNCDNLGLTPRAGWKVVFADYDIATEEQRLYSYIADASHTLGAADADANLITP